MGRFIEQVRTIAPQESTIVLTGETGTGKTRLARLIHNLSPRHEQPFLVVHCGVLASNLIESELFGHTRGAFTGAERDRVGKFAAVGRGTLLLDEIDTLPVALQAKLLRVVEERAFEPVGSNKSLPTHARLIVATNRSLEEEVAAGRFRSDLYYRLNVVGLHLPPLRDRCAVIPAIARKLVEQFAARNGRPIRGIADDAMQALEEYHWPGNIRELRNVIERAVALSPGPMIQLEDLPQTLYPAAVGMPSPVAVLSALAAPAVAGRTLDEVKEGAELTRILEALRRHKNNRLRAAAELGISRMTLYKKLHKYGLMGATGSAS
jgi:DNA-binding NtrC family response regulator